MKNLNVAVEIISATLDFRWEGHTLDTASCERITTEQKKTFSDRHFGFWLPIFLLIMWERMQQLLPIIFCLHCFHL